MSKFGLRSLGVSDMIQMHRTFMEAFADYPVPYHLTVEEFSMKMTHKINLDYPSSVGAFSNEKLIGFLFHAINEYDNLLTAYNAGTGVLPGYRGRGIPVELYNYIIPELRKGGIEQCVLEVLEKNTNAIRAYKKVGFDEVGTYLCFQYEGGKPSVNRSIKIQEVKDASTELFKESDSLKTTFGDSWEQLKYNINFEKTLVATYSDSFAGYAIFQPSPGRLTRFAVHPDWRGKGIGRALIHEAVQLSKKPLTIINVNSTYEDLIAFFKGLGFKNTLDQIEMRLLL